MTEGGGSWCRVAPSNCRVILEGFLHGWIYQQQLRVGAAVITSSCWRARRVMMELLGRGRVTLQRRPATLSDPENGAATHVFLPVEANQHGALCSVALFLMFFF